MNANIRTLTDPGLRSRYSGAWQANDRDDAHRVCVEMRRRGLPIPAWPSIHEMPAELADVTPPGVMLLAVLRVAGRPVERRDVRIAVAITYPDSAPLAASWGSDLRHATASGLVTESGETLALGPRAGAILATMPEDGPHAQHARAAWEVASR